ncbi:hypothetical protein LIER_32046 [Lithospermum erythrorhizon]|uniref:Uncharacterized protein n=1 Tax=Lithospermum erythrorhizon TaxID=34254 RepID=A0AAV3RST6_LITER
MQFTDRLDGIFLPKDLFCLNPLNIMERATTISVRPQALVDFITECTAQVPPVTQGSKADESKLTQPDWILFVDGARNEQGAGAGVPILGPQEETMEMSCGSVFLQLTMRQSMKL